MRSGEDDGELLATFVRTIDRLGGGLNQAVELLRQWWYVFQDDKGDVWHATDRWLKAYDARFHGVCPDQACEAWRRAEQTEEHMRSCTANTGKLTP